MTKTETLVENMVGRLQEKGLKVLYAKCDGFTTPEKLQGAEPDVIGWDSNNELLHVGLVADSKIIKLDNTQKKIDILAKLSMGSGNSKGTHIPFYLGIPKDEENTRDQNFAEKLTSQSSVLQLKL